MPEHTYGFSQKALALYEASELKQQDVNADKACADKIKSYLRKFEIEAEVSSNPFEIEGISFYSEPVVWEGKIIYYGLMASRECSKCKARPVLDITIEDEDIITPEMFGQWLSRPHLCEFKRENQERIGFR
jgi:hypothetical protein